MCLEPRRFKISHRFLSATGRTFFLLLEFLFKKLGSGKGSFDFEGDPSQQIQHFIPVIREKRKHKSFGLSQRGMTIGKA